MRLWDAVKAAARGVEDDGTYDAPNSPDNCAARRAAAFKITAEDLGLPSDWGDKPFGVIIEWAGPRGVSTLIAYANGDAGLLHEDGSGIIGRQNHVHVVKQAKRLVASAADLAPLPSPTDAPSPPASGSLRFYLLTQSLLSAEVASRDVQSDANPWSPLMDIADELISEISQYLLTDVEPAGQPRPLEFLKALAMVAVIGGMTYAASLIPSPFIRWPLVSVGLFLSAAALFVFYAMLAGSRDEPDEGEATTAR
jgi:hypothetical protein